jgi:hypothetical protein
MFEVVVIVVVSVVVVVWANFSTDIAKLLKK